MTNMSYMAILKACFQSQRKQANSANWKSGIKAFN